MRVDKYLKLTRLIKRRELAKQMLDAGYVSINGKVSKPSNEIKVGDTISIKTPSGKLINVEVVKIADTTTVKNAAELYKVKEE